MLFQIINQLILKIVNAFTNIQQKSLLSGGEILDETDFKPKFVHIKIKAYTCN